MIKPRMPKITRRKFVKITACSMASIGALACNKEHAEKSNIIIIIVDDLNNWVNASNKSQPLKTKWIDKLAKEGTIFENAYCAAPYCNASRMALFTGCWPQTTGIYKNEDYWDQKNRNVSFIESAASQGYQTFSAGKVLHGRYNYQKAKQEQTNTAEWIEIENREWLWSQENKLRPEPLLKPFPSHRIQKDIDGRSWSAQFDWGTLTTKQEINHPDVETANATNAFLKQKHTKPYLAIVGFYKPHLPWYAPQRWLDEYPIDSIILPEQNTNDLDDVPNIAKEWAKIPADEMTLKEKGLRKEALQAYKASISFVDEQIGRVLQTVWEKQSNNDTIIALCSDNGFHLGEKLHWRKFTLWEEATHVPMIISSITNQYQFKKAVKEPVSLIDLFPTVFDLAGIKQIKNIDGHSLRGLMTGERIKEISPAISTWGKGNISIRTDQWRYTYYSSGEEELYNHYIDPKEHHNLATLQHTSEQRAKIKQKIQSYL